MKIGLLLPQGYFNEFEGWQPVAAWERILEIARLGERLGFDALWTGEHTLAKWDPEGIIFDCVTLHTAVAAAVPRVDIGFGVINSTFRNPAMTAKMASTLDTISGGRLILGLGCGFKPSEASAFGCPVPGYEGAARDARRALRDHQPDDAARRAAVHLRGPVRAGRGRRQRRRGPAAATTSGCAIGGHGKNVTMRLAAKYCDEINIDLPADALPEAIAVLADRCDEIGRDPATLDPRDRHEPGLALPGPARHRPPAADEEGGPAGDHAVRLRQPAPPLPTRWRSGSSSASTASSAGRSRSRRHRRGRLRAARRPPDGGHRARRRRAERVGRPMEVGLVLPQGYFNEFEGWEPGRAWARIVELAQTAERLGFESIWTGEHVLSKWPGESIAFDCWALSSGLAPLVPRVGIGLIVMNSTFHNPAMTAKAASTLDAISGGRLTLGLGAGFKENEAAAFGHPLSGAQGPDGVAVGALRDHLAGDPDRTSRRLLVRGASTPA